MKWIRRWIGQLTRFFIEGFQNSAVAPRDETADRANLIRIQITGFIGLVDCTVEVTLGLFRHHAATSVLMSAGFAGLVGFMVLARLAGAGGTPPIVRHLLPTIYIPFLLLFSETSGYFIALYDARLPFGYAMLILALSAIFMVPPKRFIAIAGITFAIYLTQLSQTPHTVLARALAAFNTGLAVVGSIIIRIVLYRLRQREQEQLRIIAEQNEALQRTNAVLAAYNSELNELMAVAAHDLRSPLFGLRNLLDLALSRDTASPELYRNVLEEGSRSITTMLVLVGRLLKAHEVENTARIVVQPEDLRSALVAALRQNAMIAQSAGISIETRLPPDPVWALVEQDTLGQILANLLSNAIRFSPADAIVAVECDYDGEYAVISVTDAGPGVPPGEREHLFGKFRRGSNEPLRGGRGSGLGLYISSKLTAAMGGELRYEPLPGGGSKFSVALVPAFPDRLGE